MLLLVISRFLVIRGNDLLADFLTTLYFVLAHLITFVVHYRLVARHAKVQRTTDEFVRFSSVFLGFTIPINSALQVIRLANPTVGAVLLIALTIPLLGYAVRVWQYFWGLRALTTLFYLWVSSLFGALGGLAFIFLVGLLLG